MGFPGGRGLDWVLGSIGNGRGLDSARTNAKSVASSASLALRPAGVET